MKEKSKNPPHQKMEGEIGKFVAIQSYLKRQEKSQINNLILHLKQLEKEKKQQQQS